MSGFKRILMFALVVAILFTTCITSSAVETENGLSFKSLGIYRGDKVEVKTPATYEATVLFPEDTDATTRGGVILGNYYSSSKKCFNFEIYTDGQPRVYFIDDKGEEISIVFNEINVYSGKKVHVAITLDNEAGVYKCYINGALKQTLNSPKFSTLTFNDQFCLGSDLRTTNSQYFKGTIFDVAIYSDIRTASEISKDATATAISQDGLLFGYDLNGYKVGDEPKKLTAIKGPDLLYKELWMSTKEPVGEYDYSFALIGDIQTLTAYYPSQLPKIFDWLVDNAKSKKMAHVFHLGDITDNSTPAEWELAKAQYKRLEGVVPYTFVRGNHDSTGNYNKVLNYEEFSHLVTGAYEENMLNTYKKFKAGENKYLVINLDIRADNAVLAWANKLVEDHPDYNVIVTTHIYLGSSGKLINTYKYNANFTGQDLWDLFISKHENIVMAFCGHSPTDQIKVVKNTGVHGNEVTQILVDPQTTDKNNNAAGLVAMLYFSNGGKHVEVEYYSTVKKKYFLDSNQLSFDVNTIKSLGDDDLPTGVEDPETDTQKDNNNATQVDKKPADKKDNSNVLLYVIIGAGVVLLLGGGVTFAWYYRKKKIK